MSKAVPEPVTRLIDAFAQLPGVGPKTASRLTYYLLRQPDDVTMRLSDALRDLKTHTRLCSICFNITIDDPCGICGDAMRDQRTIAVVEEPLDVLAVERTGSYTGVYHVLHGAISPVHGVGPDDLKIRELVARADLGATEIIVATNPGMEGDATAMFIQRELRGREIKLTRLARGLPVGGDIEYADTVTLMRALQGRSAM
ncbi:MAG: recombination mediator RecR [Chloroflexota bacterium]|nr:recombination mediator RecR [Chloroflexota bacterium]